MRERWFFFKGIPSFIPKILNCFLRTNKLSGKPQVPDSSISDRMLGPILRVPAFLWYFCHPTYQLVPWLCIGLLESRGRVVPRVDAGHSDQQDSRSTRLPCALRKRTPFRCGFLEFSEFNEWLVAYIVVPLRGVAPVVCGLYPCWQATQVLCTFRFRFMLSKPC